MSLPPRNVGSASAAIGGRIRPSRQPNPFRRVSENERVRVSDAVTSIVGYTVEQRLMAPEHKLARIVATTVLMFILARAALGFWLTR